jgi:ArsR family transcriptional regulator
LGFSENKLYRFLKDAGFRQVDINVVAREEEAPNFQTVLASGVKS